MVSTQAEGITRTCLSNLFYIPGKPSPTWKLVLPFAEETKILSKALSFLKRQNGSIVGADKIKKNK